MWTSDNGQTFYEGDCRAGDRAATAPELALIAIDKAKREKAGAIAAAYAAAIGAGLLHGGALYQIDAASQQRIAARALLARACIDGAEVWPVSFGWIATDNSRPTFTAAGFWAFAMAAQNRVTALTLNARDIKDEITAARTVAEVEAIDASSGWA
jgi:hypothetical protein